MRDSKNSLSDSVQASLEAFDTSSNNSQLDYNKFLNNSAKATIQILLEVGLFDRFDNKVKHKSNISLSKNYEREN